MKRILYKSGLFLSAIGLIIGLSNFIWQSSNVATAQRIATPVGSIISLCPGTTITQTSPETLFFSDTVRANTLINNRHYPFKMICSLTTPAVGVPGLTLKLKYGTQTFTLMSNVILAGSVSNGLFTIEGDIVSVSPNNQFVYAKIMQPSGGLLALTNGYFPTGTYQQDASQALPFTISAQFTGTSLGTSQLTNQWMFRDAY